MHEVPNIMRRRFKIKKVFNCLLISYIIMLVLPSIFIWGLYRKAVDLTVENSVKENIATLSQAAMNFENHLEYLDNSSRRLVYDMNFKDIMLMDKPKPADDTVWDIVKFSNDIYEKLCFIGGGAGYFVILKDNEFIFANNFIVYGLEFYFNNFRKYSNMTYKEWYEQSFNSEEGILLPMASIKMDGNSIEAITYSYPIKGGKKWNTKGLVQFLIKKEYLENLFSPICRENNGAAYILDSQGNTIAYTGVQSSIDDENFGQIKQGQGYFYSGDKANKKIAVYIKSQKTDLIYTAFFPKTAVMAKANVVKQVAILSIFTCLVIEIFISILFAWKYATPISNIIKNLQSIFSSNTESRIVTNEYEYLEKGVSNLIINNQTMKSNIEKERNEMRLYFIGNLLEGRFKDKDSIKEAACRTGISLDMSMYCVVSFNVEKAAEQIAGKLFKNDVNNLDIRMIFYYIYNKNIITVLFGFTESKIERNRKSINDLLIDLNNEIFNCINQYASIGIGRMYKDAMDIPFSFTQSYYSATISSKERRSSILEYESVSQETNMIYYPVKLELVLINSTKHGETHQIKSIFEEIYHENIQLRNLSPIMCNILVANIEATLVKVYSDVVSYERIDDVIGIIHKCTEVADTLRELENQFILVSEYIEQNKSERMIMLKFDIEQYIMQNYGDPTLGIASMADYFALSETYFSQLFKEIMGESFSAYVQTIRINKAKELLLNSNSKVERIASVVGYNSGTTFRRAFKRVMGISPSTYKTKNYKG